MPLTRQGCILRCAAARSEHAGEPRPHRRHRRRRRLLGSYIAVGLSIFVKTDSKPLLFTLYAIAFLLFSIPCLLFVKERGNPNPRPINLAAMVDSLRGTYDALRHSQKFPGCFASSLAACFIPTPSTPSSTSWCFTRSMSHCVWPVQRRRRRARKLIMLFAITFAIAGGFAWAGSRTKSGPPHSAPRAPFLDGHLRSCCGRHFEAAFFMFIVAALAGFRVGRGGLRIALHAAVDSTGSHRRILRPLRHGRSFLRHHRPDHLGDCHLRAHQRRRHAAWRKASPCWCCWCWSL